MGNFVLTCPFEAFLYSICRKNWLKELAKRNAARVTLNENQEYTISEGDLRLIEEAELMQARRNLFIDTLQELGENCRHLLKMNWSGKSLEEVAKTMNISYGYARKKKSQCMTKLIRLIRRSAAYNSLKGNI